MYRDRDGYIAVNLQSNPLAVIAVLLSHASLTASVNISSGVQTEVGSSTLTCQYIHAAIQWASVLPQSQQEIVGRMLVRRGLLSAATMLPLVSYRLLLDGYDHFHVPVPKELTLKITSENRMITGNNMSNKTKSSFALTDVGSIISQQIGCSSHAEMIIRSQYPTKILDFIHSRVMDQ